MHPQHSAHHMSEGYVSLSTDEDWNEDSSSSDSGDMSGSSSARDMEVAEKTVGRERKRGKGRGRGRGRCTHHRF